MSSHISSFKNTGASVTVPTATNSVCFINVIGAVAASFNFGANTIAVEIINDDATNNLGIRFDGGVAVVPANAAALSQSHMIRPKESRYFPITVGSVSLIASAANVQFRLTGYI